MSQQLSFLPEPMKLRKPTNPYETALWREGVELLIFLTGLKKPNAKALVRRLLAASGERPAELLTLIRKAAATPPDLPIPWLISASRRLKTDEDPWRLKLWYDKARPEVQQWPIDELTAIMLATGLPTSYTFLDCLEAWLVDGYRPDSIESAIGSASLPPVITSLSYFDRRVRALALRWNPERMYWGTGF